jgi:hypothetical protein
MKYPEIIETLSVEMNLPQEVVDTAYKSFYAFMREVITGLPLKEDLSEEEFGLLKTNFNIPALGKLHCTYDRYLRMKEQQKYIKKIREEYGNQESQED